jgi:hypothetical protein
MKLAFILTAFKNSASRFEEKPMKSLRRVALTLCMAVVMAGTALAGETNAPPCPNPGETNAPPCSTNPYITDEVSETTSSLSSEVETMVIEAASYAVESLLTLF